MAETSSNYTALFLGQGYLASLAIREILVPDGSPLSLKAIVSDKDFYKNLSSRYPDEEITFVDGTIRNEATILKTIKAKGIDLILSVQHPWIISPEIIESVDYHAFNLHNAKLPAYKGYNCITHAIHNGDTEYTSTLHWMVAQVDAGDIAYEEETTISPDDDALSLYLKTTRSVVKLIRSFWADIQNGKRIPRTVPAGQGTFYTRNQAAALKDITGLTDAVEVDRRIRASFFPPYEPAYLMTPSGKHHLVPDKYAGRTWKTFKPANRARWET